MEVFCAEDGLEDIQGLILFIELDKKLVVLMLPVHAWPEDRMRLLVRKTS